MKTLTCALLMLTLLFLGSCDNDEPMEIKDPFLTLKDNGIIINSEGGERIIKFAVNTNWSVSEIPEWCIVDKTSGKGREADSISIIIEPNETYQDREASIRISADSIIQYLSITQRKILKTDSEDLLLFPVNWFDSVKYTVNGDKGIYSLKARSIFINRTMRDKIYLGNLIDSKLSSFPDVTEFNNFTFNPITASSMTGGSLFTDTFIPSKKETESLAAEVRSAMSEQSESFYTGSPMVFTSYKQLYFSMRTNLGIDLSLLMLDENLQPKKEMKKGLGLIYTFCQKMFSITMDYPEQLIKEDLDDKFIADNNLSYISNITYGRTRFLIVESAYSENKTRLVVQKVMDGEQLNEEETGILDALDVHCLDFWANGNESLSGGNNLHIIKEYTKIDRASSIMPLSFSISSYPDHSVENIEYRLILQ